MDGWGREPSGFAIPFSLPYSASRGQAVVRETGARAPAWTENSCECATPYPVEPLEALKSCPAHCFSRSDSSYGDCH